MRPLCIATLVIAACTDHPTAVPPDAHPPAQQHANGYKPHTRTYYIAAEDTAWNYAPLGSDPVYGRPLPGPWGTLTVHAKQHYVQYSDSTFTARVAQPAWRGILGPMIRGVVGDTLRVVFLNRTSGPLSIHPHGVRYDPADEGSLYNPPRGGGDSVSAGGTYAYIWRVVPESGPLPGEPSSKVWLYHSHVVPEVEVYRGLVGTIVVTDPVHARDDGSPDDVTREFTTLWLIFNENTEATPESLAEGNLKHAINGYFFGNLPGLTMHVGDRVRWYVVALGTETDWHTPHWHGETILVEGKTYNDVIEVGPASMRVGDMVADNPGTWLLHCHVGDHMMAGMYATYTITGSGPTASASTGSHERGAGASAGWSPFRAH